MHLLEFVLGIKQEDITDEFEKIKAHSERIEKEPFYKVEEWLQLYLFI